MMSHILSILFCFSHILVIFGLALILCYDISYQKEDCIEQFWDCVLGIYEAYFMDSIQNEMGSCDAHMGNVSSWYSHFEVLELDIL